MRQIFTIFRMTVLRNLRDTGNVIGLTFVFPMVIIFIMGTALSPMFAIEKVGPAPVGYFNADNGPMGLAADRFMAEGEIGEYLQVQTLGSSAEGAALLAKGEITAFIMVPEGFSARIGGGEKADIGITGVPGDSFNIALVETIMKSFVNGANATLALGGQGVAGGEFQPALGSVRAIPFGADSLNRGAMGYYAVTMLVMITLYGTMWGASGLEDSRMSPRGKRVRATPISPNQHHIGIILGNTTTFFASALVVILLTGLVYGVSWGGNLPLVMATILMHIVLAIAVGTAVFALTDSAGRASALLHVFVVASTTLAGGYNRISLPQSFGWLQYLSPSYLAQTALFNTIYEGPLCTTLSMLAAMGGIIVAAFTISTVAERRRG